MPTYTMSARQETPLPWELHHLRKRGPRPASLFLMVASMTATRIQTRRLELVAQTLEEVRAQVDGMDADQRKELSPEWLARLDAGTADLWTLGFAIVDRATGSALGTCGFKGPSGTDGIVEIAYGIDPTHRGKGYATEAAEGLVAYAFRFDDIRVVRAHTLPGENASTRVLAKARFEPVGEVVDPEDGLVWRWERTRV